MLTKRLLCAQQSPRVSELSTSAEQARRAHLLVVVPSGRAHRYRAHALVCGRAVQEAPVARARAGYASAARPGETDRALAVVNATEQALRAASVDVGAVAVRAVVRADVPAATGPRWRRPVLTAAS